MMYKSYPIDDLPITKGQMYPYNEDYLKWLNSEFLIEEQSGIMVFFDVMQHAVYSITPTK